MDGYRSYDLIGLMARAEGSQEKEASSVILDRGILKVMVLARSSPGENSSIFIELSLFPGMERGPLDPVLIRKACMLIAETHALGYQFFHDGGLVIAERKTAVGEISEDLSLLREVILKVVK